MHGTSYSTSGGFDDWGSSIGYRMASAAGIAPKRYVDEHTLLYIPMYGDDPFVDQSINKYTVTNTGVTADAAGGLFTAADQYLLITPNPLTSGLKQFSLEFDYCMTSIPSGNGWSVGYYFATNGSNNSDSGCDMLFGKTQININFGSYNARTATSYTPDVNVWHHFKLTRDGNNLVTVEIDGSVLNSYTDTADFYNGSAFAIGRPEPYGATGTGFRGWIKNYRIQNPLQQKNPVFYAPLSSAESTARTGQALTTTGNVEYSVVDGIPCAIFNGNSTIYMPAYSSEIPINRQPRTVSAWMKPTSPGWAWAVSWGTKGPDGYGDILGITSAYNPVYSQQPDVVDSSVNCQNKWVHVCGVVDTSAVRKIYVDGVLKGSGAMTRDTRSDYGIHIGSSCGVEFFSGWIAAVRVYSRALTQTEILALASEFTLDTESDSSSSSNSSSGADTQAYVYAVSGFGEPGVDGNYWDTGQVSSAGVPIYTNGLFNLTYDDDMCWSFYLATDTPANCAYWGGCEKLSPTDGVRWNPLYTSSTQTGTVSAV